MRFAPKLSVGARLTLTMIVVVVLTWLVGGAVIFRLMRLGFLRPGPPRERPPRMVEGPMAPDINQRPLQQGRTERHGRGWQPPAPGEGRSFRRPPPPSEGVSRGRRPPPPRSFWRGAGMVNLLVGLFLSVAAGIWLSRRFTRPLAMLAEGAGSLGKGNLDHRVPLTGEDEFGKVAASMNQMAERIGEQVNALQADSRRRQQLLADVAHELRSPVATLKTMAEALRDGVAAGPERSERAIRAIVESATRMERLVNDLMDLAWLDLDEFPLHRALVDLRAAAADCVRRHSQAAESAGIRILLLEEGTTVIALVDPHRLAQILDNLVDNAISHAGSGAEVEMTVELEDKIIVTVSDTGRGISAEYLPYLFDPFFRGDAARTPGGRHSGLGLRIARGLALAHGGDLRIESVENQGTRAILTLPALKNPT